MDFDVFYFDDKVAEYRNGVCTVKLIRHPYFDVMLRLPADKFLESRIMPKERWGLELSEFYGLSQWDPEQICRKTHGYRMQEPVWVRFVDEPTGITYDEVKLQIW